MSRHQHDAEKVVLSPSEIPKSYYTLDSYVSPERMLTFWHQLREVLALAPKTVLEVGIGSRVVAGALREIGLKVQTADINPELAPAYLASVQELSSVVGSKSHDVVLCARVLHHVPFEEFEKAISELAAVATKAVVLTLPVDDFRIYFGVRVTSRRMRMITIPLPLWTKNLLLKFSAASADTYYRSLWKIGSTPEVSLAAIESILSRHFTIQKSYAIPEDRSHRLFVLHVADRAP